MVIQFLSPDNITQSPYFTQNYNRYMYCFNNPLKFTDPTGYTAYQDKMNEWYGDGNYWYRGQAPGTWRGQGGGTSGGSGFYGRPGQGINGTGLNGVYYDWYTECYRSTSSRKEMGWDNVLSETILPNASRLYIQTSNGGFQGLTASKDGVGTQTRPSFTLISANYPANESSPQVYTLIGGKVYQNFVSDPVKYENSCALRLSYALNYSGAEIPHLTDQTGSGFDGKWYFYRVSDLNDYLSTIYGPPDITGNSGDMAGKTGIIMFQNCGWRNASGHFDLWDGNSCLNNCHWDQCSNASLWLLP
jgi:hypothetical protein